MKIYSPLYVLAVAGLLGTLSPIAVSAQDAATESPRTFVVTASRVEEDAMASPTQTRVISVEN
ncbi:hypothetical protein MASR2M78_24440 [Treponema sp.]